MTFSADKVGIWNRALGRIGVTKLVQNANEKTLEARVCDQHYDDCLVEVLEQIDWAFAKKQAPLSKIDEQVASFDYDVSVSLTIFEIPFSFLDNGQVSVAVGGSDLDADDDYAITPADPQTQSLARIVLVTPLAVGQTVTITVTTERIPWEHVYTTPNDCVTPLQLLPEGGPRRSQTQVDERIAFEKMANDAGTGTLICTDADIDTGDFDVLEYIAAITYVPALPRQFVDLLVWRLAAELALAIPKDTNKSNWCMQNFRASVSMAEKNMLDQGEEGIPPDSPSINARR